MAYCGSTKRICASATAYYSEVLHTGGALSLGHASLRHPQRVAASPDSDQAFGPYQSVTDLTLSPAEEMRVQFMTAAWGGGVTAIMVDRQQTLAQLLEEYAGNDLHWLACRVRFGGLDTQQGGFNDDYVPSQRIGV